MGGEMQYKNECLHFKQYKINFGVVLEFFFPIEKINSKLLLVVSQI